MCDFSFQLLFVVRVCARFFRSWGLRQGVFRCSGSWGFGVRLETGVAIMDRSLTVIAHSTGYASLSRIEDPPDPESRLTSTLRVQRIQ